LQRFADLSPALTCHVSHPCCAPSRHGLLHFGFDHEELAWELDQSNSIDNFLDGGPPLQLFHSSIANSEGKKQSAVSDPPSVAGYQRSAIGCQQN
jgi:hypothetical protein